MKKTSTFFQLFLLLALSGNAAFSQIYTIKDGSVSFYSKAPIEDIQAATNNLQAILNTTTKEVAFIVPIRSFQFAKDLMKEHFNEKYMESDKYPNAAFSGKIKEDIDWAKDGTYTATATGDMKIHGVKRQETYEAKVTVKDGDISIQTSFKVPIKDYNIEKPKLVFQNIADTILVKMDANFKPYKK